MREAKDRVHSAIVNAGFARTSGKLTVNLAIPVAVLAADHRRLPPAEPGSRSQGAGLDDVQGNTQAKGALTIAAEGSHNLLFTGPPGSGKTMLADCLPVLMPTPTTDEALAIAAVASVSNTGFQLDQSHVRPFRAPQHSAPAVWLVGGSSLQRPGETTLPTLAFYFLTNCLSSVGMYWRCYVSPWNQVRS